MILLFGLSLFLYQSFRNVLCEEFCSYETFKTHCKHNEVAFIEKAIYGRQKYGKCLSIIEEPDEYIRNRKGFIGCFSDVKHIIEPRCAGRQSCDLSVVKIQVETNCSTYLLKYLEIDYICVKGKILVILLIFVDLIIFSKICKI